MWPNGVPQIALSNGEQWSCHNAEPDLAQLSERLAQLQPTLVVMEATGGYEQALAVALYAAGVEVRVVNPRQAHHFARALGAQAKSDRIDAQRLARFAQSMEPAPRTRPEPEREELKGLVQRRQQLQGMLSAERNRREHAPKWLRGSIDRTLRALQREVAAIDHRIADKLEGSAQLKAVAELLTTVPGVGRIVGPIMIARLPEVGRLSRREIAAVVGWHRTFVRAARGAMASVAGGRAAVRSALYTAALTGIRHNPVIRALSAPGRAPQVKESRDPARPSASSC